MHSPTLATPNNMLALGPCLTFGDLRYGLEYKKSSYEYLGRDLCCVDEYEEAWLSSTNTKLMATSYFAPCLTTEITPAFDYIDRFVVYYYSGEGDMKKEKWPP
jgi:hypothetical protein